MQNNKISKSIKILSLITTILIFIICMAILTIRFVNTSVLSDAHKHLVYNIYKFSVLSFLIITLSPLILMMLKIIKTFKKTTNNFYSLFKTILCFVLILLCIILLFAYSKKYVVKVEIWYGHISFYTSLLALLDCLMFSFYITHTNKFFNKLDNAKSDDDITKYNIKQNGFIFETIWLGVSAIIGFVSMFFVKQVAQTTSMVIVMLFIEMCFQIGFMFYLVNKNKSKDVKKVCVLSLLIFTVVIACFIITSYYYMYPVDIIDSINLNYFIAGWDFTLTLLLTPTFVLGSKRL